MRFVSDLFKWKYDKDRERSKIRRKREGEEEGKEKETTPLPSIINTNLIQKEIVETMGEVERIHITSSELGESR